MTTRISHLETSNGVGVPMSVSDVYPDEAAVEVLAGGTVEHGVQAVIAASDVLAGVTSLLDDIRNTISASNVSNLEVEIAISLGGEAGWFVGKVSGEAGVTIKAVWDFTSD